MPAASGAPLAAPSSSGETTNAGGAASATAPPKGRCVAVNGQFTLSPLDEASTKDEPSVELPFAVEIGSALDYKDGFAISALRGGTNRTVASITLLSANLSNAQLVDLGQVHGDVSAPKIAASGDTLIAVVPDGDVSGTSLRLARVSRSQTGFDVAWGAALHDGDDESRAFEVALNGDRGILAWDDWDKAKNTGVIRLDAFKASSPDGTPVLQVLSLPKVDAESPRVVERATGFWASWVVNDEVQRAASAHSSAHPGHFDDDDPDDESTLVPTRRGVEIRPLDELGNPIGVAQRVTPEGALVLDFDLAPAPDGGAWVIWREGAPSVASSGGKLSLVEVGADGTITPRKLDDIELGAGSPVLLTDSRSPAAHWLAVPDSHEQTVVARLGATPEPLTALSSEPALRYGIPVALRENDVLLAHPRGRSVVLHAARCE